ncbi:hypothetical protein FKM82_017798 [Ascaphus truei]
MPSYILSFFCLFCFLTAPFHSCDMKSDILKSSRYATSYDPLKDSSRRSVLSNHAYSESYGSKKKPSSSQKDLLSGLYHDQRNYSSLKYSKPVSTYHPRSSSLYSDPLATTKSYRVSID